MVKGVTGMRLGLEGVRTERTEVFTEGGSLWLGFGWRGVSLKAIIGAHGFWGERAAEGGRLVAGMFLFCSLEWRKWHWTGMGEMSP